MIFSGKGYGKVVAYALDGEPVSVRGRDILERRNVHFVLRNPIDRVVVNTKRKINPAFAIAEFISLVTGYNNLDLFTNYISSYNRWSTDGKTVDGGYGERVAVSNETGDQLKRVINELNNDRGSRRAVIQIFDSKDLHGTKENLPCTLSLQFYIRNNCLHMTSYMRSNDVILGFPYDVFQFTMLMEYISLQTHTMLGEYNHVVTSFHIYQDDIEKGREITRKESRWIPLMREMSLDEAGIRRLLDVYLDPNPKKFERLYWDKRGTYECNLAAIAVAFANRKENGRQYYNWIYSESTLRRVLRPYLGIKDVWQ